MNPDVYAAALTSILSGYSAAIVYRVSDPRTGIVGRSKWLPSIAEVRQDCEREAAKVPRPASVALPARDVISVERKKELAGKLREFSASLTVSPVSSLSP